jgi:hypothetical protein
MKNRFERRREKALSEKYCVVSIKRGRLAHDPTLIGECFICDGPAKAWACHPSKITHIHPTWTPDKSAPLLAHGYALLNDNPPLILCEGCFNSEEYGDRIMRKVVPGAVIQDCGEATPERVEEIADALNERERSTSH